jgi:hypothetical protein
MALEATLIGSTGLTGSDGESDVHIAPWISVASE